jgi:hypothetical protein
MLASVPSYHVPFAFVMEQPTTLSATTATDQWTPTIQVINTHAATPWHVTLRHWNTGAIAFPNPTTVKFHPQSPQLTGVSKYPFTVTAIVFPWCRYSTWRIAVCLFTYIFCIHFELWHVRIFMNFADTCYHNNFLLTAPPHKIIVNTTAKVPKFRALHFVHFLLSQLLPGDTNFSTIHLS